MKYSIVVPVYNVEKYIEKCLESILAQTYKNFEVIIVNDGSTDSSIEIVNKYLKKDKRFKCITKENGGLSDARNIGIKECSGDYLILIDSDDYVEKDCLEKINEILLQDTSIDVLKFKLRLVDEKNNLIREEIAFNKNKIITFEDLVLIEFLEPACLYAYNLNFWNKNKFTYVKNKFHEDFGLTPEVLMKANKIYYLNEFLYNYVQRENSITSVVSKEKDLKKAYDMLEQYDRLISIDYNKDTKVYKSFLANGIISKSNTLEGIDRKQYIKELKIRNVLDNILNDTFLRKMKKLIYKIKWVFIK